MGMGSRGVKSTWRASLLASRSQLTPAQLTTAAAAVARHVLDRFAGVPRIAAYVPVGREPGSVALLDALRGAGTEVLLPVVMDDGLSWGLYTGTDGLTAGPLGTRQPAGPRVSLAGVEAVLVPALAVDRTGVRLGRGGGYYDRALASLPTGPALAALLHDGELVDRLPADPWDRSVTTVVTPSSGWTELPDVEHHGR
jgi:5-formyltetrahydrofolate cyclo-ligase